MIVSILFGESSEDDPKIISLNGNIIVRVGSDKNISFETTGECSVLIHGADFSNAVPTFLKLNDAMSKYSSMLANSAFQSRLYFWTLVRHRVGSRITKLENSTLSLSHSRGNKNLFDLFKTEISQLKSSVNRLKSLLTENDCAGSPCKNGGTCQDLLHGVYCKCADGWEGAFCEKDVNECIRLNSTDLGCQNGGVCKNLPGTYICLCVNGWNGIHCNKKTADCNSGSASEICGHGICIPQNNASGRKCLCKQGWKKREDGEACTEDVNECEEDHMKCSRDPPVSCENTPGSFRCGPCPAGYTGNGFYCSDINECELSNGGCSVTPLVECQNTPGSRICGPCPPGYIGNGMTCSFVGICKTNNGNCHPLAECHDYPSISATFVECKCPTGYSGNGIGPRGCVAARTACSSNPCEHGVCVSSTDSTDGYICICSGTYYGKNCENTDGLCSSNPCQNGGTCINHSTTSYGCICSRQFIGHDCSILRQECGSDMGLMEDGLIAYPSSYSTTSSIDRTCTWQIQTEEQKIFNITFEAFHVGSDECTNNWLEVIDGKSNSDLSLGKFCGNKIPNNGSVLTTGNNVLINLRENGETGSFLLKWTSLKSPCHDVLILTDTSHGTIKSLGSPGNYPNNRDCHWFIRAPIGKLVSLTFYSFNIGNDTDCTGDFLEFSSSFIEGQDIFTKICGSSNPKSIQSPGPELEIHFHSNEKDTYSGFEIHYSTKNAFPGCGHVYTKSKGTITSLISRTAKTSTCFYQIKLDIKLKITLTFTTLSMSDSPGCLQEYVAFYQGSNTSCPLIGRYCGNKVPASFISTSESILVKFKSKEAFSRFTLQYKTECGGVFDAPSGFIQSEGYPKLYPNDLTCVYLIKQPPGSIITLELQDLSFEYDTDYYDYDCSFDYLEIRDGDNENSTLIGTFCDSSEEGQFISNSNNLYIKFVTDAQDNGRGFKAKYSITKLESFGCGGLLTNKSGIIQYSPSSSGKKKCRWILRAPRGFFIRISWINFEIPFTYICEANSVKVYENSSYSQDSMLLGSYCGNKLPPILTITSNVAAINVMVKEPKLNFEGFSAYYIFLNETTGCNVNYFSRTGSIKSPNYPNPFPSKSECVWTITLPANEQIVLSKVEFKIGRKQSICKNSYLEIRNGGSVSSPLIGQFCHDKIPKQIISHTNQLYLKLVSNFEYDSKFLFTWSQTTGCGGTLTSEQGAVASPHYPEPYNRNSECFWRIMVSRGSLVQLVFSDVDLEEKRDNWCISDYIEVYDGRSTLSKRMGRFCDSNYPALLTSTNNEMDLHFRSDISLEGRGFSLRYKLLCSNNLTGFGGIIESPNYPEPTRISQDCYWNITVPPKNNINISFSHFDLTEFASRRYLPHSPPIVLHNYLEIQYGVEDEDGHVSFVNGGRFGNTTLPAILHFPSNRVMVHFKSASNILGNGFRLEWQIDGCGGHIRKPGSISSPNFPKKYPNGIECEWLIEAPLGYSVAINFTTVDVEKGEDCLYDGLHVHNGPDTTYARLGLLCYIDEPVLYTGNGRFMFIRFVSDNSYAGLGFLSTVTFVKSMCGGEITARNGILTSPNYPKNFDKNSRCEWLITIDENHIINFQFEVLDLEFGPLCRMNYVRIYDGSSKKNSLLANVCGNTTPNGTYTSSTNQMLVVFEAFSSSLGFKASYHKACGARIQVKEEVSGDLKLHSLSLPTTVKESECTWTLISPNPGQRILLTITHMKREEGYESASVAIYNGESSSSPLLGKYKDDEMPPTIFSNGAALHVVVDRHIDFYATYEIFASRCGGTLTGLKGIFSTPDYPNSYIFGTTCEWTLQVAPGNQVSLSFQNFDIPGSERCNMDFLEIRSVNVTGKLLGVFCGDKKPNNITNQGSLWIYFRASKSTNSSIASSFKGFLVEYATASHVDLIGYTGLVASPLYPNKFSALETFSWKISLFYKGSRIKLEFQDMYIESFDEEDDTSCFTSRLTVYDGSNNESPVLGTYCGTKTPAPVESSSNTLFIEAEMTSIRFQSKFLLKWTQIYYRQKNESCGSRGIIDISKMHQFNFTSPGYPIGCPLRSHCEWKIQTTPGMSLRINFTDIRLSVSNHYCFHDLARIYSRDKLVKTVCHQGHAKLLYNTTNLMKVVFESSPYRSKPGFAAIVTEACGGLMTDSTGIISFEEKSPKDKKCAWTISGKAGRRIELTFPKYSNPSNDECTNFILIKNGLNSSSPDLGLGKFCQKPPKLLTTSNSLYIEFNGEPNRTMFVASYREILYDCGGPLSLNSEVPYAIISSPNYPNISEPFIECLWTINSPTGTFIQIDFHSKFDLHGSTGCLTESVELRDGGTVLSPLIGKFCRSAPSTHFSSDNYLFVKFFTEENHPGYGFQANISIGTCGGTYKDDTGEIEWIWKGKPANFQKECIWNIIGPPYGSVSLEITLNKIKFSSDDCAGNGNFSVYAVTKTSPIKEIKLADMCDGSTSKEFETIYNHVIVRFTDIMKTFQYLPSTSIHITYRIQKKGCSYSETADFGVIQSPGYPNLNYSQCLCSWTINVKEGRRITFNITDLDLEKYSSATTSSISPSLIFYEYDLYQIDELYYNSTKRIIKSSSNMMQIYFFVERSSNARGFSASYTSDEETVCNADFTSNSGRITRNQNEAKYNCFYGRSEENRRNKTFTLQVHSNISKNISSDQKSMITVGTDRIGKYLMGSSLYFITRPTAKPTIIRSVYPDILVGIEIQSKDDNFTIDYQYYPCGGTFDNMTGFINTPSNYLKRLECSWLIKRPPGDQIKLIFNSMDLGQDCEKTFVIIYNGEYSSDPRIGKFCNTNKPDEIISQKNKLLIEYHKQESTSNVGFNATYESVTKGCGGLYTHKSKGIKTPNYPNDYPNNAECRWIIMSPEGTHMTLKFLDRFHLEDSRGCANDYVQAFVWREESWRSAGKWCGRLVGTISSPGNKIMIVFKSNNDITASGFRAEWKVICGATLRASIKKQYVISPGYPHHYEDKMLCRYNFYSPETILIEFEDFSLEGDFPSCTNDNVTITSLGRPKSVYCGQEIPAMVTSAYSVAIVFQSDEWITAKGFKLSYKVKPACGESISVPKTISLQPTIENRYVPLYHSYRRYEMNKNCHWTITAPKDKVIVLKLLNYTTGPVQSCYLSSLEIFDSPDMNNTRLLGKICGNQNSQKIVLTTTQNNASIYLKRYRSDQTSLSLEINFASGPAEGCGGKVNLTKPIVLISAKNLTYVNCMWKFEAAKNHRVQFKIKTFKLPSGCIEVRPGISQNCTCSYIEIRDGYGPFSEQIEQICINIKNGSQMIETSRQYGFLRFYSEGNTTDAFEVSVSPILDICGSHELQATYEVQTITSPGYPSSYDDNIKCLWTIKTKEYGQKIELRFVMFDLTNHTGHREKNKCLGDRIEIDETNRDSLYKGTTTQIDRREQISLLYLSYSTDAGKVMQFCGKEFKPFVIYSRSNTMHVGFVSTAENEKGKGFKLEYLLAGCNRDYYQEYGRISVPTSRQNCSIHITTPENTTVAIYFNRLWTMSVRNCSNGGVKVYDGPNENSRLLLQHCGYDNPLPVFGSSNKITVVSSIIAKTQFITLDFNFLSSSNGAGCGGKIFDESGTISSPLYPHNYTDETICVWEINVPVGSQLAAFFRRYDIHGPCPKVYLKVATYNKGRINERIYCGIDRAAMILSDNRITITYQSSSANSGRGWLLYFRSVANHYSLRSTTPYPPLPRYHGPRPPPFRPDTNRILIN